MCGGGLGQLGGSPTTLSLKILLLWDLQTKHFLNLKSPSDHLQKIKIWNFRSHQIFDSTKTLRTSSFDLKIFWFLKTFEKTLIMSSNRKNIGITRLSSIKIMIMNTWPHDEFRTKSCHFEIFWKNIITGWDSTPAPLDYTNQFFILSQKSKNFKI